METVLLNPNTAAQNPVSHQGASATDSDTGGEFSPVMDEAVTNTEGRNNQQGNASSDGSEQTTDAFSTEDSDFSDSDAATIHSAEVLFPSPVSLSPEIQSNPLQPQGLNLSGTPQELNLSGTGEEKTAPLLTTVSPGPVIPPGTEAQLPSTTKAESLLLQQIQQILDQGKNNGSITITVSNNSGADDDVQNPINSLQNLSNPLLAESKNVDIQARQAGLATLPSNETPKVAVALPTTDDTSIATHKSAKLEGAHQNIAEQFYNAKLGESKTGNGENFNNNSSEQNGKGQQNKNELQAAASQTPGTSVSESKPLESGFGQLLSQNAPTAPQATSIEGKLAPGAYLPVPEREMVNNLIQRFNVNPRLQTSKLTMQLHPAELGALKIDILVKEDSLKAHIVTQSQQVMDTLEKHMPRLREVLQEQGFTVDSFEISMEGDGGQQREMFQEHFDSQQQEFASNGSSSQRNEVFDTLLETQNESEDIDEGTTGVNLTV